MNTINFSELPPTLSRDEVRDLFMKHTQEQLAENRRLSDALATAENALATAENARATAEKERATAEKERATAEKERDHAVSALNTAKEELRKAVELINHVIDAYAAESVHTEYYTHQQPLERFGWFIAYCERLIINNAKLRQYLFGNSQGASQKDLTTGGRQPDTGSESADDAGDDTQSSGTPEGAAASSPDDAPPEPENPEDDLTWHDDHGNPRRRKQNIKCLGRATMAKLNPLLKLSGAVTSLDKTVQHICGKPDNRPPRPPKSRSGGRRVNSSHLPRTTCAEEIERLTKKRLGMSLEELMHNWSCPNCGKLSYAVILPQVRSLLTNLSSLGILGGSENDGYFLQKTTEHMVECSHCGYTEPAPQSDPALLPGHSITLSATLYCAIRHASGIPLYTQEQLGLSAAKLGNSTMDNSRLLLSSMLMPLYKKISDYINNAPAVGADETTYTTYTDKRRKSYICSKSTQPGIWPPAVYFYPPGSRSMVSEIAQALQCAVLVSDGYEGYQKFSGRHQLCCAHLAVKISEIFANKSSRHIEGLFRRAGELKSYSDLHLENRVDAMILMAVIYEKLSTVFAWETQAAIEAGPGAGGKEAGVRLVERRAAIRREHTTPLWDDIDHLFQLLKPYYARLAGGSEGDPEHPPRYDSTASKSPAGKEIATVVVYYLNGGARWRTHLSEPLTAVDDCHEEQLMKCISKTRKNSQVIHSARGGQALSVMLTCMHTARQCGITAVATYLFEVASWVRMTGIRQISLAAFRNRQELELGNQNARITKRNYNQREVYEQVTLPDQLLPWKWAQSHPDCVGHSPDAAAPPAAPATT